MVTNARPLTVGVASWYEDDGIAWLLSDTLDALGCRTISFLYNEKLPDDLDVVFTFGPFGSFVPLVNQLLTYPSHQRPLLVLWLTEQFPNPNLPEWFRYAIGVMRSKVERMAYSKQLSEQWEIIPQLRWLTSKAYRYRYYGDLYWLQKSGVLSILAVASPWTADFLHSRGFNPLVTHLGYHPDWGANLRLERDIPVLWIGKTGSDRRGQLLKLVRVELKKRGVDMLMVNGVEHPYVFGQERTILLNRSKVVLNLLRAEWDDNSMRYYLAAPNRALVVTEPTLPHSPFVPGVHIVEAPPEQMADTICYYLSNEVKRQQIVDQAYQLVTTELTMKNGMAKILEKIICLRQDSTKIETIRG